MNIGFIGLGHMGMPMARNLLRAGIPLRVWNRSADKCEELVRLGAERAESIDDLFHGSTVVMLMLLNAAAMDSVLGRHTPAFAARVSGKTLVHLGTTSPDYSKTLEQDIIAAGGAYVEAPVSGSRIPAEEGRLVGMMAGSEECTQSILPLLQPLCVRIFHCGPVPGALQMKLAANHYLIGTVVALAETVHAARAAGVDLNTLQEVLDAGPMASVVSRTKLDKLVREEFSPQAAIRDVATIAELVFDQCEHAGVDAPLIGRCVELYRTAKAAGHGESDMAAVVHAFSRSDG